MDILLTHVINLFPLAFINREKVLEIFVFVMETTFDKCQLPLNVFVELIVVDGV